MSAVDNPGFTRNAKGLAISVRVVSAMIRAVVPGRDRGSPCASGRRITSKGYRMTTIGMPFSPACTPFMRNLRPLRGPGGAARRGAFPPAGRG